MKKTDKSLIQERIIDKQQEEIKILKKNNFDIKKAASDLTSDAVIPVLKGFLNNAAKSGNGNSSVPCESCGTAPIGGVADKKIISCLNAYLG